MDYAENAGIVSDKNQSNTKEISVVFANNWISLHVSKIK